MEFPCQQRACRTPWLSAIVSECMVESSSLHLSACYRPVVHMQCTQPAEPMPMLEGLALQLPVWTVHICIMPVALLQGPSFS